MQYGDLIQFEPIETVVQLRNADQWNTFWRLVADVTGRLFRLQGTVSAREVQRRVRELRGEREVVSRSTRYVLRAFADWGMLVDTGSGVNF